MTASALAAPRSLAFGSLNDGIWGAAWLPATGAPGPIVVGKGGWVTIAEALVEGEESDGEWRIVGSEVELALAPAGEALERPPDGSPGFDQLCRATGQLTLDGDDEAVSCLGWRAGGGEESALDQIGSFRQVAAWFEPGEGLALLALRPRSARGQEADLVTAAVLDGEGSAVVSDPRLSTTYAGNGGPTRAGLELWIGEDEEEQYPRRASGQSVGSAADWAVGELELHAELFSWHSRGRDGAGVYLLGTGR